MKRFDRKGNQVTAVASVALIICTGVFLTMSPDRQPETDSIVVPQVLPGSAPGVTTLHPPVIETREGLRNSKPRLNSEFFALCVNERGDPLEDVLAELTINLTRAGVVPEAVGTRVRNPGLNGTRHHGRSDNNGRIRIAGIVDGSYIVSFTHRTHVLIHGADQSSVVSVPSHARYDFIEPSVAAVRVEGDVMVSHRAFPVRVRTEPSGISDQMISKIESRLRREYPASVIKVCVPVSTLENWRVRVQFRRHGWKEFECEWTPVSSYRGPVVVSPNTDPNVQFGRLNPRLVRSKDRE